MLARGRSRTELLDQALAGQSAEVRARVQNILLRYNIDVENEFFLIFTAIGHLLAIVEESPENWRSLFDDFEGELDQWATQNLRTLEAINQQSANTERMSLSFQALAKSTTCLSSETKASVTRLETLNKTLSDLAHKVSQSENLSSSLLQQFSGAEQRIGHLERRVTVASSCSLVLLLVTVIGGGVSFRHIAQQNEFIKWVVANDSERSQWLLEKATRAECLQEIKPPSDPQCQQYL